MKRKRFTGGEGVFGPCRMICLPMWFFEPAIVDRIHSSRNAMLYVSLDVSLNSVVILIMDRTHSRRNNVSGAPRSRILSNSGRSGGRVGREAGSTSEWLTANLIELGLPAES